MQKNQGMANIFRQRWEKLADLPTLGLSSASAASGLAYIAPEVPPSGPMEGGPSAWGGEAGAVRLCMAASVSWGVGEARATSKGARLPFEGSPPA